MRRKQAVFGLATFDQLNHAREFTRQQRERGHLRSPKRWKLATHQVGNNVVQGRPLGPTYVPFNELPLWARGICRDFTQNPWDSFAALTRAIPERQRPRPVRFRRRWRPGMPW
jgi:hypothetical protein